MSVRTLFPAPQSRPSGAGRRLLMVINDAPFFLSHRLPVAVAAREAGYEVHIATPPDAAVDAIRGNGLRYHRIPLNRRRAWPWQELRSFFALWRLYRRLRPDIVHHVTIKPVLYGGIAARLARVPAVVSAVPGLGHVFSSRGWLAGLRRRLVEGLYRLALRQRNGRVILQNPDDRERLEGAGAVDPAQAVLIRGCGVDLLRFPARPEQAAPPLVVLPARMLWSKGIAEFVSAAAQIRFTGSNARFALVGGSDPGNPAAVSEAQLKRLNDSGLIEWWGPRDDMPEVFAQAHIVCLPSHREGLPKVLLEAAASARAIIATDVPGCREVVRDGDNGLLVPVDDAEALAAAFTRLLADPKLRRRMGRRGRLRAETEFGLERVVGETLRLYGELLPAPAEAGQVPARPAAEGENRLQL